jgi:hypothetical protein
MKDMVLEYISAAQAGSSFYLERNSICSSLCFHLWMQFGQIPAGFRQGLVSSLYLNSANLERPAALASTTDTSWEPKFHRAL